MNKFMNEKEYKKLTVQQQDEHHAKIRAQLIERGLITPAKNSKSTED